MSGSLTTLMEGLADSILEQGKTAQTYGMNWERFGTVVSYCCSLYGLACLIMSLILNRTVVLASSNGRTGTGRNYPKSVQFFKTCTMVLLRALAIYFLLRNLYNCLIILKVLSSSEKYKEKSVWFVKYLSDSYFKYDALNYKPNDYMYQSDAEVSGPSSAIYWPVFLGACLSLFVETFVSTVSGEKLRPEAGLTLFELSFAFHEKSSSSPFSGFSSTQNTTEVMMMICVYSILSHLNLHIGNLANKNKYRLVPSALLSLYFLAYISSRLFDLDQIADVPASVILSVLPQLLTCFVTVVSVGIFALAILAKGFRMQELNYGRLFFNEDDFTTNRDRFNVSLEDDFLTALLSCGLVAISSAGKSCYITELSLVTVQPETWIEKSIWDGLIHRVGLFKSLSTERRLNSGGLLSFLRDNQISGYGNIITRPSRRLLSGAETVSDGYDDIASHMYNEIRSSQRSIFSKRVIYVKRMYTHLAQLMKGLVYDKMLMSYIPYLVKKHVLKRPAISSTYSGTDSEERSNRVPEFLRKFVKKPQHHDRDEVGVHTSNSDEKITLSEYTEDELKHNYATILQGKEIADVDDSEDFCLENESEMESDFSDIESIDFADGQTTSSLRTGARPRVVHGDLAINELFTPQGLHEFVEISQTESSILQVHMKSSGIMTRSKYKEMTVSTDAYKDESAKLIELILEKRSDQLEQVLHEKVVNPTHGENEDDDGDSLRDVSDSRYDCVICQTNTREIITWPCRCFAICESCRLSLVAKGMEGCVCCRRDVEGVSKVFIP